MFGQSLLSAFGIACTTDTDQLFPSTVQATTLATYQLNNATTSIPSNTYPGTASNLNSYVTGKFGNAASFNGSSSYIRLPANFLNSSTQTISAWVNPSSVSAFGMIYSSYDYQTGPSKGTYMRVNSGGQIQLTVHDGDCSTMYPANPSCTGVTQLVSPSSITVNTWTHVVGVIGGSGNPMAIYINGVKVISTATMRSVGYWSGKQPLIGATDYIVNGTSYPPEYYFNGSIDQVRFFSSALPQSAITALYNETTTTATSASIDYVAANPNSIAYYKMSDTTDQIGGHTLTNSNVNFNTEGKFGFAGKFNGSNSKLTISNSSFLPQSNNSRSISCWIKTTGGSNDGVIGYGNTANSQAFFIYINNQNKLGIYCYYDNTDGTIAISNNTWNHVVATYDGTNCKLYVNGVLDFTTAKTLNTGNGEFRIGGVNWNNGGEFFPGDIDQIRIYDSAISAADVTTLYKEVECEPAAINALDQFNTVLYTGNGNNRDINVGFKPDFVWIKERADSAGYWHYLFDSIRGGNKPIFSNASNAESVNDSNGYLSSFNSNGFSITSGSLGMASLNGSGKTYVAWNWKAPLANLSTEFNSNRQGQITLPSSITTPWNTSSEFGVSCWINPNTWGSSQQTMAFYFNGANSGNIGFDREPGGNFRCFVTTSGGSFIGVNSSNNLSATNKWYHIVFTGSAAAGVKLYVDGVNTGSASWDGTYVNSTGTNSIGVSPQSLRGNIAQFRVYSSYLTASEVSDLYTEPAASNNTLNYPAGAGCIAAYPLQTDAVDLSGNYSGASSNVTFGQPGYLTSNTDGTITSAVAANQEAGFSIVSYTATGSTATVGHGLGAAPDLILAKTSNQAYNWIAYSSALGSSTQLLLDSSNAAQTGSSIMASTDPTSTVFTAGAGNNLNYANGNTIIAYCFTSIPGYSKIGSYVGNGSSNPIYVGFQPKFVMAKQTTGSGGSWLIMDSARGANKQLYPNLSSAEYSDTGNSFSSTGFTMKSNGNWNNSGQTYIYLAIA